MLTTRALLKPAVWGFYLVIVLEFLFMISPVALHFYASYGPVLNFLHRSPWTSWLTGFFLPHFSATSSPLINSLRPLGFGLAGLGLLGFGIAALQVYGSKLLRRGPVTGGAYRLVRHPQYLALAVLGLGVLLIWPRFLVLISYITMLFLYVALAVLEEQECLSKHGEPYSRYLATTGRILPRSLAAWIPGGSPSDPRLRLAPTLGLYALAVAASLLAAVGLRGHSLARVSAFFEPDRAVLSPARLSTDELHAAYETAIADPRVGRRLAAAAEPGRFIIYVVPEAWHLPDLPLHPIEQILEERRGGHTTPSDFDRSMYKVLFTRARLHAGEFEGPAIVARAHGRDPLALVHVDISRRAVTRLEEPPPHVVWGDIPTPMI